MKLPAKLAWLADLPGLTTFAAVLVYGIWAVQDAWDWYVAFSCAALFVAFFFAGRTLELGRANKRNLHTLDERMADAKQMVEMAERYLRLHERHYRMTGERYSDRMDEPAAQKTFQE